MHILLKEFLEKPKKAPVLPPKVMQLWEGGISQFHQSKYLNLTRAEFYALEATHAVLLESLNATRKALEAMAGWPQIDCKELKLAFYYIAGLVNFIEILIDQEQARRTVLRKVVTK